MNKGKLALILLVSLAVNETARIRQGKDIASPIIGTAVFGIFLLLFAAFVNADIATVFALLFLVASVVVNGQPILDFLSQITESK